GAPRRLRLDEPLAQGRHQRDQGARTKEVRAQATQGVRSPARRREERRHSRNVRPGEEGGGAAEGGRGSDVVEGQGEGVAASADRRGVSGLASEGSGPETEGGGRRQ